jgi:enoyl-CoA hydratase
MAYETILTDTRGRIGVITLNRPKALNALNAQLMTEMNAALDAFQADPNVAVIVLSGNDKAFAAGADIREMKDKTYEQVKAENFLSDWDHFGTIRKPIIAAVWVVAANLRWHVILSLRLIRRNLRCPR